MSRETLAHLNTNTLIGFADKRGHAWHYREQLQDGEPNHYPGAIPVADVHRRLFDWEAESWTVQLKHPVTGEVIEDPEWQAIVHSKLKTTLGMFKEGYQRHQYAQWLVTNVAILLDDDLGIGSAGLLKGGAQAWVQVEVSDAFIIDGTGVEFRPNLLACTSFDGSLATTYKRTITNVVCDNTMAAGLAESGHQVKIRHSRNSLGKVGQVRDALALVVSAAEDFEAEVRQLLATEVTPTDFTRFLDAWAPVPDDDSQKTAITNAENKRSQLVGLYKADPRVAPWNGTGWGVVQAVNTWAHHTQGGLRAGTGRAERNMARAVSGETHKSDVATAKLLTQVLDRPLGQRRLYAVAA